MRSLQHSKLYDLAAASPLILFYGFAIVGLWPQIGRELSAYLRAQDVAAGLSGAAKLATLIFLAVQMVLFLIRRLPERSADGFLPRAAAVFGANLNFAFLLLPRARIGLPLEAISTALVLAGTIAAIMVAIWLGRGFSILPQARRLVTSGPYRVIRHPLYLAEQVATFGAMLQFREPWAILLALAVFAAQFPRMHYEERVLSQAYPEYRDYAARTARLIPGVY